ncbi:SNF2 family DNA or RNA helicase [Algoriphagus boseongensis]|uniref:SNF2 family DNA or RNA helicase n=1 Tax=Algoriphagus boseongensis TaxID=1442587 RepID=A0A4R6T4J5_9BACT|nr:DEAD/DEAH box helicase [Algoriphagus boseongensis]TDQ17213.1 SNF2 family DNA or RNA helicase [Algoriphagus boseongensis]
MIVNSEQPFQIVYSIFSHEYLGLLFESFVVQLDEKDRLSLAYQNISYANAKEFDAGLDKRDYDLIKLMDSMQPEVVVKPYMKKGNLRPKEFLNKIFDPKTEDKKTQDLIFDNLEIKRSKILPLLIGKRLFEMGSDGNPTWKEIQVNPEAATVLFHFHKNPDNTHYWPTIKFKGQRLEWQYKHGYFICKDPAWLIVNDQLFHFEKGIDGKKLQAFLNKKFIVIEKRIEPGYYKGFMKNLITQFEVEAKGFEIKTEQGAPQALLAFSELAYNSSESIFDQESQIAGESRIVFELRFQYGDYDFGIQSEGGENSGNSVRLEEKNGTYTFYKTVRTTQVEKKYETILKKKNMVFVHGKFTLPKTQAFEWLGQNEEFLEENKIKILQKASPDGKTYHIGKAQISIEVNENIDWFDVKALIKFGVYLVPFSKLRRLLIQGKTEFELPNGEIAVIPASWFVNYSELFNFIEERSADELVLKKHHLAYARELQNGELIQLNLSLKLERLRNFDSIEEYEVPSTFQGSLRPYQHAGYNWLRFLNEYHFGGCLADDMGLGKTVQTLALLAHEKEENPGFASLLVMPTSLIYNWELEARKFTPELKVLVYSGTQRIKDPWKFRGYDVVLTSYGIVRLDIDILKDFYFNYVILDESQAIKNPGSNIAVAVNKLKCKRRLILTGTPVENGTMDLWSQMNFVNPGLLGNQNVFKKQFLLPIEKQNDKDKASRLHAMIKPFILRRLKSQVAQDLPEKVINVKYADMTAEQEKVYEEVKNYYREKIIGELDGAGRGSQQFTLLRGLTQLRQIANHPKLVREDYKGESGKLEQITYMLQETISEDHKVLVFSQFVRHLNIIRAYLDENKIPYAYLDGATKDRQAQVEKFQNEENIKVFLISLKAGGVGLNLTKAEYVFLLDPWWNPAVEAQAIDRAHRIGQENKVIIYKFITKGSVEEKIMALQDRKLALAGELISNEESFMKSLDNEDIRTLLD